MKRTMKRGVALLLSLMMVFGIAPVGVFSLQAAAANMNEVESNNTYSTANALTAGMSTSAKISEKNDVDYFKVTPAKNGKLVFTFGHEYYEDSTNGWDISYYYKLSDGTYSDGFTASQTVVRQSGESQSSLPISVVAGTTYLI